MPKKPRRYFTCFNCKEQDWNHLNTWQRFCRRCERQYIKAKYRAQCAVSRAVVRGDMPKASAFDCVDCGVPAQCWEHRDYGAPLDVVPTCRSCNAKRGPGKFPFKPRKKAGQILRSPATYCVAPECAAITLVEAA